VAGDIASWLPVVRQAIVIERASAGLAAGAPAPAPAAPAADASHQLAISDFLSIAAELTGTRREALDLHITLSGYFGQYIDGPRLGAALGWPPAQADRELASAYDYVRWAMAILAVARSADACEHVRGIVAQAGPGLRWAGLTEDQREALAVHVGSAGFAKPAATTCAVCSPAFAGVYDKVRGLALPGLLMTLTGQGRDDEDERRRVLAGLQPRHSAPSQAAAPAQAATAAEPAAQVTDAISAEALPATAVSAGTVSASTVSASTVSADTLSADTLSAGAAQPAAALGLFPRLILGAARLLHADPNGQLVQFAYRHSTEVAAAVFAVAGAAATAGIFLAGPMAPAAPAPQAAPSVSATSGTPPPAPSQGQLTGPSAAPGPTAGGGPTSGTGNGPGVTGPSGPSGPLAPTSPASLVPTTPTSTASATSTASSVPPPSGGSTFAGPFQVTFDLTGLSFTQADIDGAWVTRRVLPSKTTFSVTLAAGSHTLQLPSAGAWTSLPFQVNHDGTVSYPGGDMGVLSGTGTTTLHASSTVAITVDVSATSHTEFGVSGCGWLYSSSPQRLRVLPGNYLFWYNTYPANSSVPFTITASGLITYDSSAAAVLTGAGSATLGVKPRTIQVDARASTYQAFGVQYAGAVYPTSAARSYTLIPGTYAVQMRKGPNSYDVAPFTIASNGTVSYDAAKYPGWFAGAGSTTLRVVR
jgi:hypothetical protein